VLFRIGLDSGTSDEGQFDFMLGENYFEMPPGRTVAFFSGMLRR
jgi:hypothetical protein